MAEKVKTSISIDDDVYTAILAIAEKEDRSFSQQLNYILKEYLRDKPGKE